MILHASYSVQDCARLQHGNVAFVCLHWKRIQLGNAKSPSRAARHLCRMPKRTRLARQPGSSLLELSAQLAEVRAFPPERSGGWPRAQVVCFHHAVWICLNARLHPAVQNFADGSLHVAAICQQSRAGEASNGTPFRKGSMFRAVRTPCIRGLSFETLLILFAS